ncbi:MAG: multicopper oxidase family protein [Acidocella sp.]|nr:multicopper oxidase family protein [Acidocella sp.]
MTTSLSRRAFLATGAMAALPAAASAQPTLTLAKRSLEVNGQPASVFGLTGPDGQPGLTLASGARFAATVQNRCGEASIIHWHGQTPPAAQDGVTDTGYAGPIANGASRGYDFAPRSGTHWMHSHQGLQEQQLMAAPLIVRTEDDLRLDAQEAVVLLHDFTFRNPAEILAELTARGRQGGMMGSGTAMGGMMGNGGGMMSGMDFNDVDFDAYLANDRTLRDPQIVRASPGEQIRLRLINGATATSFWIDLGTLSGQLIAVDGDPVQPVSVRRFPLAGAQRADILLRLPGAGAFPVLAQREGGRERTGLIIATPEAAITKLAEFADIPSAPCGLNLEARLTAAQPLAPRAPQRGYQLHLTGSMMGYDWGINGRQWANHEELTVKQGERVVFDLINDTMMAHPMHLHGHHFQVVALNGTPMAGAMRDTVLVPPRGAVRIAFDAGNPGRWLFHCHNLYHMASGMMTEVVYA